MPQDLIDPTFTAFIGETVVATGCVNELLPPLKLRFEQDTGVSILIFEDQTGRQVDFDLRAPLPEKPRTGPGRPKLGVVSREITLLPRHWDWLEQQPNGASAAIRRLIDEARKRDAASPNPRAAQDAAARIMTALAGNLPGYEEATRALYARDRDGFAALIAGWPEDIRAYVARIAEPGLNRAGGSSA